MLVNVATIQSAFGVDPSTVESGVQDFNLNITEDLNIDLERFTLTDSWGLIEKFGDYTKQHHHLPSYLSGVLYLHDHSQKLYFPDIKQEITPTTGRFVLFSSFLNHYTKRNLEHKDKYAISFNFKSALIGEKF